MTAEREVSRVVKGGDAGMMARYVDDPDNASQTVGKSREPSEFPGQVLTAL
jgi:hypothetical protein